MCHVSLLQEYKLVDGGFERTIASNYFGAFWLTQLLLDDLKASAPARYWLPEHSSSTFHVHY